VRGAADYLEVSVTDDGVGFDKAKRHGGLGLRGIEERVRELNGVMTIRTAAGAGTTMTVRLPLPLQAHIPEVHLARAAG
jgi:signal transduction histidine kinase